MKNSHIVLLSLLFVSSFVIPADPSATPLGRRLVRKQGTFDRCFDSPYGFGACALKGTAIAATVTAGVALTGGAGFVAYGAITGASAAAGAAAGGGVMAVGSAALTGASAGGGAAVATIATKLGVAGTSAYLASSGTTIATGTGATAGTTALAAKGLVSEVFSSGEYEVVDSAPAPAPAAKRQESPAPAPSSPRRNNGITRQDVAAAAGGGFLLGMFIEPAISTSTQLVVQDAYNEVTGKRAKLDKQREEDLAIQREALALQKRAIDDQQKQHEELKLMHYQATEQHEKADLRGQKLEIKMEGLGARIDDVFTQQ